MSSSLAFMSQEFCELDKTGMSESWEIEMMNRFLLSKVLLFSLKVDIQIKIVLSKYVEIIVCPDTYSGIFL